MYTNADLAQLLGGVFERHMDAFGDRVDNALLQKRDKAFVETVDEFKDRYGGVPQLMTMKPEAMWLFQTLNINPLHFAAKEHKTAVNVHGRPQNGGVTKQGLAGAAADYAEAMKCRGNTSQAGMSGTLARTDARAQRNLDVDTAMDRLAQLQAGARTSAAGPST